MLAARPRRTSTSLAHCSGPAAAAIAASCAFGTIVTANVSAGLIGRSPQADFANSVLSKANSPGLPALKIAVVLSPIPERIGYTMRRRSDRENMLASGALTPAWSGICSTTMVLGRLVTIVTSSPGSASATSPVNRSSNGSSVCRCAGPTSSARAPRSRPPSRSSSARHAAAALAVLAAGAAPSGGGWPPSRRSAEKATAIENRTIIVASRLTGLRYLAP